MSEYDLKSLQLPKLTGAALKAFTAAVENPIIGQLLLPTLLENGGIPTLRRRKFTEPPTYYSLASSHNHTEHVNYHPNGGKPPSLPFQTIDDYAKAYRNGETTPLKVADQVLAAIRASEQPSTDLRLFIAVYAEDFLSQARASTARFSAQRPLSWLDGVPMAVKDEMDMLPYPTTVGTRFMGETPVKEDSTVAARLRAAGALLVGKTNMHEIGINPNGFNHTFGAVKNPYHLECDPGGSSSGSAAVVAAGIVPAAIGADGGGSIRIPAALCGVVGLKATFGRISEYGAAPLCWSVAHLGPLTASVEDTALVYSIIAGADPKDPNTHSQPSVTLKDWNRNDLHGVVAGIYPEWFEHADHEVVKINREMVKALESRGLVIKEIAIPDLNALRIAHAITILSEMATCMKAYQSRRNEFGTAVRLTLKLGEVLDATDYIQAQKVRTRSRAIFDQVFSKVDVILTPTTARTAQPVPAGGRNGGWSNLSLDTEMMRFVTPGNLLGFPAISFPSGYDSRGMPVGLHAMGHHWEEHVLLRLAFNAEHSMERRLPATYFG